MRYAKPMTEQEVDYMRGLEPREFINTALADCKTQSDPKTQRKTARKVDVFVRARLASGEVKLYTSPKECVEFLERAVSVLESGDYRSLTDNRTSSYKRTYAPNKSCKLRTTILEFDTHVERGDVRKLDTQYFVSITSPTVYDDPRLEIGPEDLK